MKRNFARQFLFIAALLCLTIASQAQYLWNSDSAFKAGRANSGRLWGYSFGDYYVKAHSDSLSRGGSNQYAGTEAGGGTPIAASSSMWCMTASRSRPV